jgi:hypothetical protein
LTLTLTGRLTGKSTFVETFSLAGVGVATAVGVGTGVAETAGGGTGKLVFCFCGRFPFASCGVSPPHEVSQNKSDSAIAADRILRRFLVSIAAEKFIFRFGTSF